MQIEQFNKQTLGVLRNEIQNALNDIAKKHGLSSIDMKNISYNAEGTSFTTKLEARTLAKSIDPSFLQSQKRLFRMYGLPEDSIGRQFQSGNQTFQITSFDSKKPKFPVLAKLVVGGRITERGFKFPIERAKSLLEKFGA